MRLMLCFLAAGLAAADVTVEQVNKAIGLELFADANLWDDDSKAVAERLAWPQESETTNDASYRLYPKDDYRLFECRPFLFLPCRSEQAHLAFPDVREQG